MLVFEKPQQGMQIDLTGLTEEDAAAKIMAMNDSLPPHPSEINLGCGPEPDGVSVEAVTLALKALMSVPPGVVIPDLKIDFAKRTGAWFYWRYAISAAQRDLEDRLGRSAAAEIVYDNNRARWFALRDEKLRWVMRERFGVEL